MIYPRQAVKYEYDPSADGLYITVRPGRSHRTIPISNTVMMDVDECGWVLGFEILSPTPDVLRSLAEVAGPLELRLLKA